MQHRGSSIQMEATPDRGKSPSQVRTRMNSKSKVLVRSHAMREETSPPRAPTPTPHCIKLIPSPTTSPASLSPCSGKPVVVLSPSISRGNSPCRSPVCSSPTSTLVPSPASRNSPQISPVNNESSVSSSRLQVDDYGCDQDVNSKHLNKLNRHNLEVDGKVLAKAEIIVEETSHNSRRKVDKFSCDCSNPNCIKCLKSQERNFNNNLSSNVNNNIVGSSNTLSVSRVNVRTKIRQQSSGQSSFDGSVSNSPCLSRDSSSEQYTDTTGIDLELFIPETLNRNAKDRALMLRIEQELVTLAKDKTKTHFKFPPMSSYQRMLVHRCAAYFGMDHNIESSGKCVVVNKTKNTRIPDIEFKQHIKEDIVFSEEPRRSILKRDSNSVEDYNFKSPDRQHSFESRRSKSFEEREEEYEKHRDNSVDEFGWSDIPWSSTDSDGSRFRLQLPGHHYRQPGRLHKVQSEETSETLRPCVAKSYSFGGYGGVSVLTRGDSVLSTHSAGARLFTKQDSAASSVSWRLSPSSSGYKSQSQRSESVTPSPTSTPYPSGDCVRPDTLVGVEITEQLQNEKRDTQLVWAVTDIHSVPKGSVIINPQTGQPYKNEDGSIYHYDPVNPPSGFSTADTTKVPASAQRIAESPKKSLKERPPSPKRRPKSSPCKKSNLINSSTSPSLPFTPPPSQNRMSFYTSNGDSIHNVPQHFPIYTGTLGSIPSQDTSVPVFQPPCIVYAPYSVQPHFEGRIESQLPTDIPQSGYYVNVSDSSVSTQPITYQAPQAFWNQQPLSYYPNAQPPGSLPPHHRFSLPLSGQPGFISAPYQSGFIPQATQTPQSQDLVPIYPQQQVQVIYPPTQPSQQTSVMYSSPGPVLYSQTPVYPSPIYPHAQAIQHSIPHYPQNTSTPNSCTSSVSNAAYCRQAPDVAIQPVPASSISNIAQNMSQMNISCGQINHAFGQGHQSYNSFSQGHKFISQQVDSRQKSSTPKGGKYNGPKNFSICSTQNSTGTSSPATTVAHGYCSNPSGAMYRSPTESSPVQNLALSYGHSFIQPVLCRQASNASTVGTNRSSRSPTPASDTVHLEKQRMSLPPTLYQGMPYILQADNRVVEGRGQPNTFRQTFMAQPTITQGPETNNFNRMQKNRKARGNKPNGLPPMSK